MSQLTSVPQELNSLEALKGEIQQLSEIALQQKVFSTESKDAALAIGSDVKRLRKALDERRKQITSPLQDTVKKVIAFAQTLDRPLELAEAHIRTQAVAYAQEIAEKQRRAAAEIELEKQRIRREEELKLKNAAAMAESFEEQHVAQEQVRQETREQARDLRFTAEAFKAQGVKGTTEVWTFEITDPALVPREYLKVDESLVRQAVVYAKRREIPGVRIYQETRVRLG